MSKLCLSSARRFLLIGPLSLNICRLVCRTKKARVRENILRALNGQFSATNISSADLSFSPNLFVITLAVLKGRSLGVMTVASLSVDSFASTFVACVVVVCRVHLSLQTPNGLSCLTLISIAVTS